MWVYFADVKKTFLMKNADFDLVHTINGAWILESEKKILFEYQNSYYIIDFSQKSDGEDLGFSNQIISRYKQGAFTISRTFTKKQDGWITVIGIDGADIPWKKIIKDNGNPSTSIGKGYRIDTSINKIVPYPVVLGSEPLTEFYKDFDRKGYEVWKSNTLTGEYTWQGEDVVDSILVGWHKFTHKALDSEGNQTNEDVVVFQGKQLIEISTDNWSYIYNGVIYSYSGILDQSNILMSSGSGSISLNFDELVEYNSNVIIFDGGAQIVD